jgi:hypothetical protein
VRAAIIAALLIATPAAAEQCFPRQHAINQLDSEYNEKVIAMGLASSGGVLEVLVSPTGSWSIIVTQPNGTSCLMISGEHWGKVKTGDKI